MKRERPAGVDGASRDSIVGEQDPRSSKGTPWILPNDTDRSNAFQIIPPRSHSGGQSPCTGHILTAAVARGLWAKSTPIENFRSRLFGRNVAAVHLRCLVVGGARDSDMD